MVKGRVGRSGAEENKDHKVGRNETNEIPVCNYAPEWSEHARFDREDEPCDDGRMGGRLCAEREGDDACPVTDNRMSELHPVLR